MRHPELGYFDEGFDLENKKLYKLADKDFGRARRLVPTAFRSKIFADLENEKLWTRSWICVGTQNEIPAVGDILPFTVGNHGIHVQRTGSSEFIGRFNKAQHGGCRSIPAQCQTGIKTKCSFTSCGYSRDRGVITNEAVNSDFRLGGQYLGDRPERLLPVRVSHWGQFIFVNLDQGAPGLDKQISSKLRDLIPRKLDLCRQLTAEYKCNWKLIPGPILETSDILISIGLNSFLNKNTPVTKYTNGQSVKVSCGLDSSYLEQYPNVGKFKARQKSENPSVQLVWIFPNLVICIMPDHVVSMILQPTATAITKEKVSLFVDPKTSQKTSELTLKQIMTSWSHVFKEGSKKSLKLQEQMQKWSPGVELRKLPLQTSRVNHEFQRYLVKSITASHEYYWPSPSFSGRGG